MTPEVTTALRKLLRQDGKPYSPRELDAVETSHRTRLPDSYRRFLEAVGPGSLVWSRERREVRFYRLEEIEPRYAGFLDDPSWLFSRYLPIGADEELQEINVVALDRPEGHNFARIWHEYGPADWGDEKWGSFEDYLGTLATCDGKIDVS
jgi:hypothetical protein